MMENIGNQLKVGLPNLDEAADTFDHIQKKKEEAGPEGVLSKRVHIPTEKIERAILFWKPRYFDYSVDGRHMNGVEAYALGDSSLHEHPNKVPYIAMCNLMALEAMRRMNGWNPTTFEARDLAFGHEREKEIADWWKKTFAPTVFQSEWAWKGAIAVMAGEPIATRELLDNFVAQLPDE